MSILATTKLRWGGKEIKGVTQVLILARILLQAPQISQETQIFITGSSFITDTIRALYKDHGQYARNS